MAYGIGFLFFVHVVSDESDDQEEGNEVALARKLIPPIIELHLILRCQEPTLSEVV